MSKLVRCQSTAGVVWYESPLLQRAGIPHAFTTRLGGVSPPPFDSLNLGHAGGETARDTSDRVAENYLRVHRAIGTERRTRCFLNQVHGGEVVRVEPGTRFTSGCSADALLTSDATKLLSICTADCVPVLLSSEDGRTVAAAHAGWRGVIAGVVPNAVRMIGNSNILCAIGPCISFNTFEVGPEVLDAFATTFGHGSDSIISRGANGKGHADLAGSIRLQLLKANVAADRIDTTDRCTYLHTDEFFSHRRDRGLTGRMASLIGPLA